MYSKPSIQTFSLSGVATRLEPLQIAHLPQLRHIIQEGELWKLTNTHIPHPDQLLNYFQKAEIERINGNDLTFAIFNRDSEEVSGCTRFRRINFEQKKVIIGPTFIAKSWQGTYINLEAKFLMLEQAFEHWKFNRIELLCDVNNHQSRRAITKLGAQEEGILRAHRVMPCGRVRDSVMHSILRENWPTIRPSLEARIASRTCYAMSA